MDVYRQYIPEIRNTGKAILGLLLLCKIFAKYITHSVCLFDCKFFFCFFFVYNITLKLLHGWFRIF